MKAYGLSTLFLQEKPIIKMLGFKILFRENAFLSPEENASGALFTCIFLSLFSNPHPPTPWHPSTEYSLGRSPYLDQILFLPLLHDVTWSKCLNLSEPWLLNFCITMLNNIHWTRLWGRRFSEHRLWKHSPDWPSRTQCCVYLRFSNKEINCLLIMTTGPSSDSWALRIKGKIPHRAAPQTFKSNHLLPQILPLLPHSGVLTSHMISFGLCVI